MKLLFLALDVDLDRNAGDSIHVRELTSSLGKLGHSVELLARGGGGESFGGGVRLRPLRSGGFRHDLRAALQVAKETKPEAIYERRLVAKVGLVTSRLFRAPLTLEVNGLPDEERSILNPAAPPPSRVRLAGRRILLLGARTIVAVSESIRQSLQRTYGLSASRITVVPNGVNIEKFRPMDKLQCRKSLGLNLASPAVGFVGNLVPWQGVDVLIRSAGELRRRGRPIHVLIVGDGPDRRRLEILSESEGLSGNISFFGSVPYSSVPVYIGAFDVGVSLKPPLLPGSPL